jgi:hypothetical protein
LAIDAQQEKSRLSWTELKTSPYERRACFFAAKQDNCILSVQSLQKGTVTCKKAPIMCNHCLLFTRRLHNNRIHSVNTVSAK